MQSFPPIAGAADSISVPHSRGGSAPNAAPIPGAARGLPCRSAETQSGGAAAPIAPNLSEIGAGTVTADVATRPEGRAAPNPSTIYGPPTTSRMDGAGGAFNDWDCKIAKAKARGDLKAVDELKQARADINIKLLQSLEPVWVPTESQLAIGMMLRVAAVEGVCTLHTQAMQSEVRL